jgi:threonine synthase
MSEHYTLRCRECNRDWGNRPSSICEDCLAPLEVKYDLDAARSTFTRDNIARRPANIWRYS